MVKQKYTEDFSTLVNQIIKEVIIEKIPILTKIIPNEPTISLLMLFGNNSLL